jgi:hypothetical protein
VDPWTGEDLAPELELALASRPYLAVDRADPWTPSVVYPTTPYPDKPLDGTDPWARSDPDAKVIAQANPSHKRPPPTAHVLDPDENPWGGANLGLAPQPPAVEGLRPSSN